MAKIVETTVEGNITTTHTMETRKGKPRVGELARIKATGKIHEVMRVRGKLVTLSLGHKWVQTAAGRGTKIEATETLPASELERVIVVKVEETETEPEA